MKKPSIMGSAPVRILFAVTAGSAILLELFGCTTLRTSREPVGGRSYASDNKARVGIYYFLPKALITIEGQKAPDDKQVFQVTVTRTMVADQRHRYHLRWTQNPFYDDQIAAAGITVNDQGLLTTVPFTATDQTPAIANDLATTAVNVFKILGHGGGPTPAAPTTKEPEEALHPFKYTFDPLDTGEVHRVELALAHMHIHVIICHMAGVTQSCIGNALTAADAKSSLPAEANTDKDNPRSGGVLFHPPLAMEMRFNFRPAGEDVIHRETIMIPDPTRVACFRFGRSPLVSRETVLTLQNGMPTGFSINRPSPIHGFTTMLSTITGTIAAAIPTIVNVKVNRQTADLNAQKQLIDAQTSLANSQNALATALATASGKSSAGSATPKGPENLSPEATTEALNALGKTMTAQREQIKNQRAAFIKELRDRNVPDAEISQKLKDSGFEPLP